MCGISGFCNLKRNHLEKDSYWNRILEKMNATLSHRGCDNFGTYLRENCGFAHARLSIRDIANGNQPMIRKHKQKEYAIVYNGEIYNTAELKKELLSLGYSFSTTSDTEVILSAFMHYGPDFVSKLNGIFAFAIWDETDKTMYLYRDRVGIKPCFYANYQETLIFASEPKALFCYPNFTPVLTFEGLQEILGIGPARTMGNGIFKSVSEVLPGHYLIFSDNRIKDVTYWDLVSREHTDSYEKTVETVSFLVRDSVNRQMVSDVAVCTFLSGGIDSSIVTALAYNHLKEKGEQLNTFSFDFSENDKYFQSNAFQPERDLPYVNIMLEHYPSNHTYLECDEKKLYHLLFDAVRAKDYPGMADVDASLLYFCSLVKQKNKVALTGECADEIFGGYPWFYREDLMNRKGFPWSADATARTPFLKEDIAKKLDLGNYSYDHYKTSLAKAPLLEGESKEEQKRRTIAYLNIKWFMQTLLDRMDRTSMYSGLEARVPFADHRIIEYVFNVPWEMKYRNGVEKALLRDACSDLLPPQLLNRKKSPYPKTYHPGYLQLLIDDMKRILEDSSAPIHPLLDCDRLRFFLEAPTEYGKPWFGQLMAGPQLLAYYIQLNAWMQTYHLVLPF